MTETLSRRRAGDYDEWVDAGGRVIVRVAQPPVGWVAPAPPEPPAERVERALARVEASLARLEARLPGGAADGG